MCKNSSKTELKSFKLPLWKRIFDVTFASIAIIILSPLLIIVALLIYLEDRGPVIYSSPRAGANFKIFKFLKFRSMYINADKHLDKYSTKLNQYGVEDVDIPKQVVDLDSTDILNLESSNVPLLVSDDFIMEEEDFLNNQNMKQEKAFVKLQKDPRVTKIGQFIRKYSIDELPQLFNIIRGDMSIVGNRPLPLYEAELLTNDKYIDRFLAPAGLTGLWQVEKRGDSGKMSPEERKQLDIYYANNYSFWFDMKIILKTFTSFIQKESV